MYIKAERAETSRLEKVPLTLEVVNLMQCLALSLLGAWSSEGLGSCWAHQPPGRGVGWWLHSWEWHLHCNPHASVPFAFGWKE